MLSALFAVWLIKEMRKMISVYIKGYAKAIAMHYEKFTKIRPLYGTYNEV